MGLPFLLANLLIGTVSFWTYLLKKSTYNFHASLCPKL
jgi:hypothetical protein